jgi:hypothetical protein
MESMERQQVQNITELTQRNMTAIITFSRWRNKTVSTWCLLKHPVSSTPAGSQWLPRDGFTLIGCHIEEPAGPEHKRAFTKEYDC